MVFLLLLSAKEKRFKENPPGTVYLTDTLYIDAYPVKVYDYLKFLESVKLFYNEAFHDSVLKMPRFGVTEEAVQAMLDTFHGDSVLYDKLLTRSWVSYGNDDRRFDIDFRLRGQRYYNYPIVNINIFQMRYYCQWRTDMVMLDYAIKCKTEKKRRKYPWTFEYRMVKRKEWQSALGKYADDVKREKKEGPQRFQPKNTVKPYMPERGRDFYYDPANAAETLDQGVLVIDFEYNKQNGLGDVSYTHFNKADDWITFRCICEILSDDYKRK